MSVDAVTCEHGMPRFLCRRCEANGRAVASESSGSTTPINVARETSEFAQRRIMATIAAAEEVHAPLEKAIELAGAPHAEVARSARPTQANILAELAQSAELFHAPDGTGYADLHINGHRETWPIRSLGFRRWLTRRFFEEKRGVPNSQAMQSALNLVEARAHFGSPERSVCVRVGGLAGRLYLDLVDEDWRAIEIDSTGWRIVDDPPVRFRRASGMQSLPEPVLGGSVAALRRFLNVHSDRDFVLAVSWALACLRNRGPYPVIALAGEQGSAKSTFSAILRSLVDPNSAPLRALPREDRELFIAASNSHVLAFDNVSGLRDWISDTLCRLATGGGFAVRQLYTDLDEVLFNATRPVILNGIEEIVTRPDLADRALFLTLQPIPEELRRPEGELWAAFEAERPKILGALLDAVVVGLKRLPETSLPKLPRMADFALWATACEAAMWSAGTFMSAYAGNLEDVVEGVLEASPVAVAVRAMMQERTVWAGTASALLQALPVDERTAKSKGWPHTPNTLSGKLRRDATFLRRVGINVAFGKETNRERTRIITITKAPKTSEAGSSASSEPSGVPEKAGNASDVRDKVRTEDADADYVSERDHQIVRSSCFENKVADATDDADATLPHQSEPSESLAPGWRMRL